MDLARPVTVEGGVERFLGAGLSNRTGDADDRRSAALARSTAQRLQRGERVFDEHVWAVHRLRDDDSGGAGFEGGLDELMAVVNGPGHGDEQVARADLAAVEGDAGDLEGLRCSPACRGRDFLAG